MPYNYGLNHEFVSRNNLGYSEECNQFLGIIHIDSICWEGYYESMIGINDVDLGWIKNFIHDIVLTQLKEHKDIFFDQIRALNVTMTLKQYITYYDVDEQQQDAIISIRYGKVTVKEQRPKRRNNSNLLGHIQVARTTVMKALDAQNMIGWRSFIRGRLGL